MKMKMSCPKNRQTQNKTRQCGDNKCNPFMACASGNFYTVEKGLTETITVPIWNEKMTPENDNRIFASLSDCWHPPENG